MNATLTVVMVVGGSLAVGGVILGLIIGYWRGRRRGIALAANERLSPELDLLAGAGNAILSVQLKVDALCEVVYQQATRIVDTRNFQIGLYEDNDYTIKVWLRNAERLPPQRFEGKANEGISGWVRRTGSGLLVRDFQAEWDTLPAHPSYETQHPARSAIFAPLISGGTTLGLIAVQSDRPQAFDDEDMRLLTLLANQASAAIRNAQTFEAAQERARQLRLINDVTRQVTAIQPLPDLFRQIVTLIHDAFGYYAVSIFTVDDRTQTIHLRASSREQFEADRLVLQPGQGLVGWTAAHRQTAVVADTSQDDRFMAVATLEATRSEIAVPLHIQNRVLGVLDVQSNRLDAFGNDDIYTLETLAGQLALALQEAQSYDAERRQGERVNAMVDVARAVVSILNIDDLLDEVVDLVSENLGYDRVHLFLRVGDRVVFRSGSGVHSGRWALERLSFPIESDGIIPRVARTGTPEIVDNVERAEWNAVGPGVEDTRSEMTVPIRIGSHILGVFDIMSTVPSAFGDDDIALIQALADTLAVALRNATLFANEARRRMLSETLRELSTVLGSSLDLNSVLEGIMVGLERVVPYTCGMILLHDADDDTFHIETAHGESIDPDSPAWSVSLVSSEVDPERLHHLLHQLADYQDGTQPDPITVPLTIAGDTIGYLVLERATSEGFSPEDHEIINTFANQAAAAITNAQLYMAQREEAWVSNALLQVAAATARATDLGEVLNTVARITPLLVGVEWSAVLLADAPDRFRVVEIAGVAPDAAAALLGYVVTPLSWPLLVDVIAQHQPVLIDASSARPADMPVTLAIGQGVVLPLLAKGELMGLLVIGQPDNSEPMTARKIELVSGIANQAALAIETAQLVTAQQEEAWVTTALLQVAEAINTQVDPDQSLETIVRLTPLLVGVERCGILKWQADADHFSGGPAWGMSAENQRTFAESVFALEDSRFLGRLATTRKPAACGVGTDCTLPLPLVRFFDSPTLLGLPLIARGHLVGAMIVDHPALGQQIDERRTRILNGIAHHTALALENARLLNEAAAAERIERELEVARSIQTSFLPETLPQVEGWEVAAFYRAARQVGGDFYDFFPVDDRRWAIVVADVADKGVPAALYMALSRTLLRAVGSNRHSPADTLTRVNDLLLRDTRSDLFVTLWYGLWDTHTGVLRYSSAGHNPPLVVRADGSTERISPHGMALGVLPNIVLHEHELSLGRGDLLFAYTDGVVEALRSDGAEFGISGLESTLITLRRKSATAIADGIVKALDSFVGDAPPFDDMTLVVLKHRSDAPEIERPLSPPIPHLVTPE